MRRLFRRSSRRANRLGGCSGEGDPIDLGDGVCANVFEGRETKSDVSLDSCSCSVLLITHNNVAGS